MAPAITIVHAGTRQIYGRPRYLPVDEAHPLRPADVNGVNKMAGEAYHLLYHDVYGINTRSLRLTNVYGPGMRIKDARQNFLGIWLRRALEGERLRGLGRRAAPRPALCRRRGRGVPLRRGEPETAGQALNVGGEAPYTLLGARRGADRGQWRRGLRAARIPARAQAHRYRRFRHRRPPLSRLTGWAPRIALADGLARSLDYYRRHLATYL